MPRWGHFLSSRHHTPAPAPAPFGPTPFLGSACRGGVGGIAGQFTAGWGVRSCLLGSPATTWPPVATSKESALLYTRRAAPLTWALVSPSAKRPHSLKAPTPQDFYKDVPQGTKSLLMDPFKWASPRPPSKEHGGEHRCGPWIQHRARNSLPPPGRTASPHLDDRSQTPQRVHGAPAAPGLWEATAGGSRAEDKPRSSGQQEGRGRGSHQTWGLR